MSDEFYQFLDLMKETTANLKKMSDLQEEWRWQFEDPIFEEFAKEMERASYGWVSSHCNRI